MSQNSRIMKSFTQSGRLLRFMCCFLSFHFCASKDMWAAAGLSWLRGWPGPSGFSLRFPETCTLSPKISLFCVHTQVTLFRNMPMLMSGNCQKQWRVGLTTKLASPLFYFIYLIYFSKKEHGARGEKWNLCNLHSEWSASVNRTHFLKSIACLSE